MGGMNWYALLAVSVPVSLDSEVKLLDDFGFNSHKGGLMSSADNIWPATSFLTDTCLLVDPRHSRAKVGPYWVPEDRQQPHKVKRFVDHRRGREEEVIHGAQIQNGLMADSEWALQLLRLVCDEGTDDPAK